MTREEIYANLLKVDLNGFISILLIILLTYIIALRWPAISRILFVALSLRIFVLLIGAYYVQLPDSGMDARTFEAEANTWSKDGFLSLLNYFPGFGTYFISWIISIPYSLFGRSMVMSQSISLFLGIASIYIGCRLAQKIFDEKSAIKYGWALALFPSHILYSVLNMREIYVVFFIIIALHGVVGWNNKKSIKMFFLAFLGFGGATLYHGGMFISLLTFLFIILNDNLKKALSLLFQGFIRIKTFIITIITFILIVFYFSGKVDVPKLGRFDSISSVDKILIRVGSYNKVGETSYPEWVIPRNANEIIYKSPLKVIYFLFSPFPWDVKKTEQLLALIDGLMYMYCFYLIFKNIKIIWSDKNLYTILLISLSIIIIYGMASGNFGSSVRHRLKFLPLILLLISPYILKIKYSLKKIL